MARRSTPRKASTSTARPCPLTSADAKAEDEGSERPARMSPPAKQSPAPVVSRMSPSSAAAGMLIRIGGSLRVDEEKEEGRAREPLEPSVRRREGGEDAGAVEEEDEEEKDGCDWRRRREGRRVSRRSA